MTSTMSAVGPTAGQNDANAVIQQILAQYGFNAQQLQQLSTWAWNEIVAGASTQQVTVDMYDQPAFQQRFPGIFQRQSAGLPPISPADYVSYEDSAKQLENQYALPSGFLSDPNRIGNLIGQDVSMNELTARVQQGYSVVTSAPPEVRQAFAQMFGAYGDGALAAHFIDSKTATPLLEQQATAADIAGRGGELGINPNANDALRLAQMGLTGTGAESGLEDIASKSGVFNEAAGDTTQLGAGKEGVEAEFGLSPEATQQVQQTEAERQAAFAGGGGAQIGTQGTTIGAAKPF